MTAPADLAALAIDQFLPLQDSVFELMDVIDAKYRTLAAADVTQR